MTECVVRAVKNKVFSSSYGASAKRAGHKKRGESRIHNLDTDQANEANKMFIIWL